MDYEQEKNLFFSAPAFHGVVLFRSRPGVQPHYHGYAVAADRTRCTGRRMGDIGASTMPDVYSQHWNAAKYPFVTSQGGFAFAYTPWLSKLTTGIHQLYASGYKQFGEEGVNSVSASLRYFTLGEVDLPDLSGEFWRSVAPHEMALDVAYARKLTETFSGAVTLRYLRADYSTGEDETSPGNAFSVDIAGYNESYLLIGRSEALWALASIYRISGPRYHTMGYHLHVPAQYEGRCITGLAYRPKNTLSFSVDLNKLLVPTRQS